MGDPPGAILGISCDYHDAAAALVVDGRVVAAAEEERFTRRKHDRSLPSSAIESCLSIGEVRVDGLEAVVFYERPVDVLHRFLAAKRRQGPAGARSFVRDTPTLVGTNLMVGYRIERELRRLGGTRRPDIRFQEHHVSHAAAAFYPSPFDQAAILTVDGIGEWTTASIAVGTGNRIEVLEELRYPNSLGLLYSLLTHWCGFETNEGEYKVMGLAPYGEPAYVDRLDELVRVHEDGSVGANARRMGWYDPGRRASRRLAAVLDGPPRAPDQPLGRREADLAASVQVLLERSMLRLARRAQESTGQRALCMAGGVALNSVANGRIVADGAFEQLWVQPAAGDAGSALGAALAHWHRDRGEPRHPQRPDGMSNAFLGPAATPAEVHGWLDRSQLPYERYGADELAETVAEALADGAVVGWFRGRMEFGPRALGHRSILADPRSPDVARRLNLAVKGREGFRPFAPAVLASEAAAWFELDVPSPYMLLVVPVRSEHLLPIDEEPSGFLERASVPRSVIPACTHVDGTARVQTVDHDRNPEFHDLLTAFGRRTGVPVLLNTSFNRAGEPIVATPEHALDTARRIGLDLLVVEDAVIEIGRLSPAALHAGATGA